MPKHPDEEFFSVSLTALDRVPGDLPFPFDLFIRRASDTYTRLFPGGQAIDRERLRTYKGEKGVDHLFVKSVDYKKYLQFVEVVARTVLGRNGEAGASVDEVLEIVKEMTRLTVFEIMTEHHVDQTSLKHAAQTIDGCLNLLGQDPRSLLRIFLHLGEHPYSVKHTISTAIFSLLLAKLVDFESERSLTCIGLGALLHDIGMSMLPWDAEDKPTLTKEEWHQMKEHPQLGRRMLEAVDTISPEVRQIVLQHHEQPNGMGYPNGLRDKQIYYPAKIVAVADGFSALLSPRPFRSEPMMPGKAMQLMHEDRGKYDPEILERISNIFFR